MTTHVEDQAHGIIGMVHITKDDLGAIKIPLPAPSEQTQIASFLDAETIKFDALTAEAQQAIDLLQERRTALISAAVTRKIDVCGIIEPQGTSRLSPTSSTSRTRI